MNMRDDAKAAKDTNPTARHGSKNGLHRVCKNWFKRRFGKASCCMKIFCTIMSTGSAISSKKIFKILLNFASISTVND